ncbi:hypothetical protein ABZ934_21540, partial [Streptomyces sp. NPDC046557]|uniref:hypothetical protein n=1 Tax=Streptomyces sp. NPDC046557 TaxID=3155372 RepID=UPI0033F0B666
MADFTHEQMRRMRAFAEQLAELAEQQHDRWKVQTTDDRIVLTMMSRTAPDGLNLVGLRRQIETQSPEVMALNESRCIAIPQTVRTASATVKKFPTPSATPSPPAADARHEQPQEVPSRLVKRWRRAGPWVERPVNAEKPRTEPGKGLVRGFRNDCSAASYSPT